MKKGKFKRRMGIPELTDFAYDNVWDHLRHTDLHKYRQEASEWLTIRAKELNERRKRECAGT